MVISQDEKNNLLAIVATGDCHAVTAEITHLSDREAEMPGQVLLQATDSIGRGAAHIAVENGQKSMCLTRCSLPDSHC